MKNNLKLILSLLATSCLSHGMFAMPNGTYVGVRAAFGTPKAKGDLTIDGKKLSAGKTDANGFFQEREAPDSSLLYENSKNFSFVIGHQIDLHEAFGAGMELEFSGWYSKVKNNDRVASAKKMGFNTIDALRDMYGPVQYLQGFDAYILPKDIKGGSVMANLYGELYVFEFNNLLASFCIGGGLGGYVNVLRVSDFMMRDSEVALDGWYKLVKASSKGVVCGGVAYQFMLMGRATWENLMVDLGYKFMNSASEYCSGYRGKKMDGVAIKISAMFVDVSWRF